MKSAGDQTHRQSRHLNKKRATSSVFISTAIRLFMWVQRLGFHQYTPPYQWDQILSDFTPARPLSSESTVQPGRRERAIGLFCPDFTENPHTIENKFRREKKKFGRNGRGSRKNVRLGTPSRTRCSRSTTSRLAVCLGLRSVGRGPRLPR